MLRLRLFLLHLQTLPTSTYELAIRHGADKPVINIKEVSESLAFDVVGMRTIDVDFRFIDSMNKCKEEIIKQIQAIEDGTGKIDSPVKFTKQAKLVDRLTIRRQNDRF